MIVLRPIASLAIVSLLLCSFSTPAIPQESATDQTRQRSLGSLTSRAVSAELKTVKIYGAGGFAGLDSYQSGFFVSPAGHVLTTWSTVLDVDNILVVTSDGTRYEANLVGVDPNLQLALLSTGEPPPAHFDLAQAREANVGTRVMAISNLYGIAVGSEMSSVQRGVIMAATELNASRGNFESVYQGQVLIIDATTNNPGATGGALVDLKGNLLGILGKELRDNDLEIWLNYAIPVEAFRQSVSDLLEGKSIRRRDSRQLADRPASLSRLGIVLVPDVFPKTPAFVDAVSENSPAKQAGLEADDLILFIGSARIDSQATLREELAYVDRTQRLKLLIQRKNEIHEIVLKP